MSISSASSLFVRGQDVNRAQPGFYQMRPRGDRDIRAAQAVAMPAAGVDVQFCRDFDVLKRHEIYRGALHVHRIIFGLKNEGRRGLAKSQIRRK
jgi:hypothetical protein